MRLGPMSIPSKFSDLAVPTNFFAQRKNQLVPSEFQTRGLSARMFSVDLILPYHDKYVSDNLVSETKGLIF